MEYGDHLADVFTNNMGDKPHCQVAGYLSVHLKGVLWVSKLHKENNDNLHHAFITFMSHYIRIVLSTIDYSVLLGRYKLLSCVKKSLSVHSQVTQ